jgi:hypothetical protein
MSDSAEMPPPASEGVLTKDQKINIEREEEKKLRAKYPQARGPLGGHGGGPLGGGGVSGGGPSGGPSFLQKRLGKGGQKYFDSGDYQMAKQKNRLPGGGIGGPRLAMPPMSSGPSTGDTIPTPELVPHRKTSIIQPLHDHSQSMHLASDPAHLEPTGRPLLNPAVAKLAS